MSGLAGIGAKIGFDALPAWLKTALKWLAVVALVFTVAYCRGNADGVASERAETAKAVAAAVKRDREAQARAEAQRVQDEAANRRMIDAYRAEIAKAAPGGSPSAPAVRLACERLRRAAAGRSVPLPAECGP